MSILKILAFLQSSLDTHSKGASARKLTAFVITGLSILMQLIVAAYCLYRHDLLTLIAFVKDMATPNYVLIGSCLGLATAEYITKKKDEKPTDPA